MLNREILKGRDYCHDIFRCHSFILMKDWWHSPHTLQHSSPFHLFFLCGRKISVCLLELYSARNTVFCFFMMSVPVVRPIPVNFVEIRRRRVARVSRTSRKYIIRRHTISSQMTNCQSQSKTW